MSELAAASLLGFILGAILGRWSAETRLQPPLKGFPDATSFRPPKSVPRTQEEAQAAKTMRPFSPARSFKQYRTQWEAAHDTRRQKQAEIDRQIEETRHASLHSRPNA